MNKAIVWAIGIVAVGGIAFAEVKFARNFGEREKVVAAELNDFNNPRISFTRPANNERDVLPNSFISCDVILPNKGRGVDAATMNDENILLYHSKGNVPVKVQFNTSGAGDAIVVTPLDLLEPSTQYTFEVKSGVKDTGGDWFLPFKMRFSTADGAPVTDYPIAFEKVMLPNTSVGQSAYTGLTWGPDGKLYAATFEGRILRYAIKPDGTLDEPETIMTVMSANNGPRTITGIVFEPKSTKENPIVWVTHSQMSVHEGRIENADDWTGKISRISGEKLDKYEDVVINLPRAFKDHMNFQPVFGPDGALYFCQGSNTSTGAPDRKWNYRTERLLTAACLRLDLTKLKSLPLDVKTEEGGTYDPRSTDAPLTLYATGVRCGYDLLWHSNGSLYCGVNGGAAGGAVPVGPNSPAIENVLTTTQDLLIRIKPGKYYGHPNPKRNEYVLMGGNPTLDRDPQQVQDYDAGIMPEKNFEVPVYDFGKSVSPNGLCEYRSNALGGKLKGKILVTCYSGGKQIIVLTPGPDGSIIESETGIEGFTQFSDPLDIVDDPATGNLYVAEYGGGGRITLLRPKEGGTSRKVFVQKVK